MVTEMQRAKDVTSAYKIYEYAKRSRLATFELCVAFVNMCCTTEPLRATAVVNMLQLDGFYPPEITYNTVLSTLATIPSAYNFSLRILSLMTARGWVPTNRKVLDAFVFNTANNNAGFLTQVVPLIEHTIQKQGQIFAGTVNLLIKKLLLLGNESDAVRVFRLYTDNGYPQDDRIWHKLMAWYAKSRPEETEKLYLEMVNPGTKSISVLLQGYVLAKNVKKVVEYLPVLEQQVGDWNMMDKDQIFSTLLTLRTLAASYKLVGNTTELERLQAKVQSFDYQLRWPSGDLV
jgi:hypothetical protein